MKFVIALLMGCLTIFSNAQNLTQNLRGTILDAESKQPLEQVRVTITSTEPKLSTLSDEKGKFKITGIPLGSHTIIVSFLGYETAVLNNIIFVSGKETIINPELREAYTETEEVVIQAESKQDAINDMATVSVRQFTIDETFRYAGALGDPARMAANFAGVGGANDARNDIIIRGNSPAGLLWRIEGVDVPSPNHFAAQGATGGPVSILNNNTLTNSDFFTGAWPSEYGNSNSGVFDLRMRNGNNEKHEFLGQIGFNGFELMSEGPINKKTGASYLASYRYSVLGIFDALGINLGPSGIPKYQDITFKIHTPVKDKGALDFWGIGGLSTIELLDSKLEEDNFSYGQRGTDVYYGTNTAMTGLSYTHFINKNSFWKNTLALTYQKFNTTVDDVIRVDNNGDTLTNPITQNQFNDDSYYTRYIWHSTYNNKLNANNTLKIGLINTVLGFNAYQEFYSEDRNEWINLNDNSGESFLSQSYISLKHRFNNKLSSVTGLHAQIFLYNQTYNVEPRLGLEYQLTNTSSLSAGYGYHGIIQPLSLYFVQTPSPQSTSPTTYEETNKDLEMTKSHHFVLGYNKSFNQDFRLKLEAYYQTLNNIPVSVSDPTFSAVNTGSDFAPVLIDSLINQGTATNYGIELTFEKFFSKNYFFLFTTSVFNSTYVGYDGVERNTTYNGRYTVNGLFGKDFQIGKNNQLRLSGKATYAGGRFYIPVDLNESFAQQEEILDFDNAYEAQYPDYFKIDARVALRVNHKKYSEEYAIDVQNVTNRGNVLTHFYDVEKYTVEYEYQLRIFPMFLYRVQF